MSIPDFRFRRMILSWAGGLPIVWLTGCGGADEATPTEQPYQDRKFATGAAPLNMSRPTRRRPRKWARQGITAIAIGPDGSIGVSASTGRIALLEMSAIGPRILKNLASDGVSPSAGLVFSADGHYLYSIGRDSKVQSWVVASGQRRLVLNGHEHALRAVAIHPNGSLVATGGEETRILIWNTSTGRLKSSLFGHGDFVNALSFSREGEWLASGDAEGNILLWQIPHERLIQSFRGHSGELNSLAFAPDGRVLASAGDDGKVLLWDLSPRQAHPLQGHASPVRCLAFNENGKVLAGGTDDGSLVVWLSSTRQVLQVDAIAGGAINAIQFDPREGNRILIGSASGQVHSAMVAGNIGS